MNELLEKLLKLKPAVRAGITLGLAGVLAAMYYVLFYVDLTDKIEQAKRSKEQLQTEKISYEKRKGEFVAYRNELDRLQEEQRELLKALPKRAEIPTFLANIQEQAELAGLELLSFAVDPEQAQDLYFKIPVKMEIRGSYHQVNKFFKNVSDMRRIVNIENLGLAPERGTGPAADAAPRVRARFVAATFRFLDKEAAK